MNPLEIAEKLKQYRLIAIIRGNFEMGELLEVGRALEQGGIRALEVTLNTPNALTAISKLRERLPRDVLVGAGTVRNAKDVEAALEANAQFLIAPGLDLRSIEVAKQSNTLLIPGVFTATEAQAAANAGCRMVKLFPADALGPNYLKSLKAPLDDLEFVPTGGITPENLGDYVRAGAAALGIGSSLVKGAGQSIEEIRYRANTFLVSISQIIR